MEMDQASCINLLIYYSASSLRRAGGGRSARGRWEGEEGRWEVGKW